jgi:hypothetical protein
MLYCRIQPFSFVPFVTADFETAFHTRHLGMFVFNLHAKFHFPSSTDSLVISTKLEANENFRPVFIYFMQQYNLDKRCVFSQDLLFQNREVSIAPTYKFARRVYQLWELQEHGAGVSLTCIMLIIGFVKIRQLVQKLKWA